MERSSDFGKEIKIRLVELGKTQLWLIERVKEKTGLYFDGGYLWKIMNGMLATPGIIEAIRDVLDLPERKEAV